MAGPPESTSQQVGQGAGLVKAGATVYNTGSKLLGNGPSATAGGINAGAGAVLAGLGLYQGIKQGGIVGGATAAVSAAKLANYGNQAAQAAGMAGDTSGIISGVAGAAGYIAAPLAVYSAVTEFKPGQTGGDTLRGAEAGAAVGSIIPGIGTAIGAVVGGIAGAVSSLFGSTDRTAASWQEMSQGGGQASFASSPAALMSAVGGLQRSPDKAFSGDTDFSGDGNKFSTALAAQVNQAVTSGKVPANATPQQIFSQVAEPWLKSLPGGWTTSNPNDPNRARVAAGEQEMVTDLISNYQQGKPITSFQVAGQPIPASYGTVPTYGQTAKAAASTPATPPSTTNPTSNLSSGIAAGSLALGAAGAIAAGSAGNNMATTGQTGLQAGLGLGSTLLGAAGNYQNAQAAGNVLSNAQAGASVGTNTGASGPNSYSTIQNGQVKTALAGGLVQANVNNSNLAAQQSGIANSFNGVNPANVTSAFNTANTALGQTPQGTQAALGQQYNNQQTVESNQAGLMAAGNNVLNNGGASQFQQAAQNQLGTAAQDFSTTYNNSLNTLNAATNQQGQQALSELNDQEFGRGQLGTSGGGLQTTAFAKGLGQAFQTNQQTALGEAQNVQNSATTNAANLSGAGNNILATGNSLLANAYGQFNNTSALGTNTANSIYGQNANISQLGVQYGQQGIANANAQVTDPASLAAAYESNTGTAAGVSTAFNNIANSSAASALAAGTQQGNQYNAAQNASANVLNSRAYSTTGGNGLGAIGAGLSALGNQNLFGAAAGGASAVGNAFGTIGNFNSAGTNGDISGGLDAYGTPNLLSNSNSTDLTNFDTTYGF